MGSTLHNTLGIYIYTYIHHHYHWMAPWIFNEHTSTRKSNKNGHTLHTHSTSLQSSSAISTLLFYFPPSLSPSKNVLHARICRSVWALQKQFISQITISANRRHSTHYRTLHNITFGAVIITAVLINRETAVSKILDLYVITTTPLASPVNICAMLGSGKVYYTCISTHRARIEVYQYILNVLCANYDKVYLGSLLLSCMTYLFM